MSDILNLIKEFFYYILIFLGIILIILTIFSIIFIIYKTIKAIILYLFKWDIQFVNKKLIFLPVPPDKNYNAITRFWEWFFSFIKWREANTIIILVDQNGNEKSFVTKRSKKNIENNLIEYEDKIIRLIYPPTIDENTKMPIYRINPKISSNLKISYSVKSLNPSDKLNLPPESLRALIDGNFLTKLLNLGGINITQALLIGLSGIAIYIITQPIIQSISIRIMSGGQQG